MNYFSESGKLNKPVSPGEKEGKEKRDSGERTLEEEIRKPKLDKPIDRESLEKEDSKAVEIAQDSGDYFEIVQQLKLEGIWERKRNEAIEKFAPAIDAEDFPTKSAAIWDTLTVLDLYDSQTAEHCVNTYLLAKGRVKKIANKHEFFEEILQRENMAREDFFFATLTHDIGKVCIPPFVIKNRLSKESWDKLFLEMAQNGELPEKDKQTLGIDDEISYSEAELMEKLSSADLRSKDIVPIKKGLSDYEMHCLETHWHLSGEDSLMAIIDKHAGFSEEILVDQGFKTTGELAGQHHHKNDCDITLPNFKDVYRGSGLADILHMADVEQALSSIRHYKKAFTELDMILSLKEEAERNDVGAAIAHLWLREKRDTFVEENDPAKLDGADQEKLQLLDEYLENFATEYSEEETDQWIRPYLKN